MCKIFPKASPVSGRFLFFGFVYGVVFVFVFGTGNGCDGINPSNRDGDSTSGAPAIASWSPDSPAGGVDFDLLVNGQNFSADAVVLLDGKELTTEVISQKQLKATVPAQKKGDKKIQVQTNIGKSAVVSVTIGNSMPVVSGPGAQSVDEHEDWSVSFSVFDFDDDPLRVFVTDLPPGAFFDETTRTISFRPDFIQGGKTWVVTISAIDDIDVVTSNFNLTINDTISPPWPNVVEDNQEGDHRRLKLSQTTDDFLDSPGYAGRSFEARIVIPNSANQSNKLPVKLNLHPFTNVPSTDGNGSEFAIHPHDPMDTYWWGYSDQLPGGEAIKGTVPNYTQRRALHLLEWLLTNYSSADAERVYVTGLSMGGAGAKTLGLLYARHFCYVEATIGQAIPRNHRPLRIDQLAAFYGDPSLNLQDGETGLAAWDRMDLTRAIRDSAEARNQFVFTKHSKDDSIIHFGAVVMKSSLTDMSFYDALQTHRVGHYVVWDEGGHGQSDPLLGAFWSDWDWNRMTHSQTFLSRNLAFPAFANSSGDQNPGDGSGNGKQQWDENAGYAGELPIPGDTGWSGDVAGCLNRFLRWDSSKIVDGFDRFEMPLMVLGGEGEPAPAQGYPSKGNLLDIATPVEVDVTIRRVQKFHCLPGETVRWSFGQSSGTVDADSQGVVTILDLSIPTYWVTLILERSD